MPKPSCGAQQLLQSRAIEAAEKELVVDAPARQSLLAAGAATKLLRTHAEIYRQGQRLQDAFLVLAGWVALEMTLENAARHIFDLALPGDLLGGWPGHETISDHSAECLTETTLCVISPANLWQLGDANRSMFAKMADIQSIRLGRAHDHILNIACRPARSRLAHFVVAVFHRLRGRLPDRDGDRMPLPLSQVQLADALAITHVHTCRLLRRFREEGILRLSAGTLEILDHATLIHEADFDPSTAAATPIIRMEAVRAS